MRKISGLTVGLIAFAATGAAIVVPVLGQPVATRTPSGASAAQATPAPSLVSPPAG